MPIRPFLDFAALVAVFAATATAATLVFQYGLLQMYGIPLALLETPPSETITVGLVLATFATSFLPNYMARIKGGTRNQGARVYQEASILLIFIMGVLGLATFSETPPWLRLVLLILLALLFLLFYTPLSRRLRHRAIGQFRRCYYSAKADTPSKKRAQTLETYLKARRALRIDRVRKRNVDWLLSEFGSAPLYLLYGSVLFIMIAYTTGVYFASVKDNYQVLADVHPGQIVLAVYNDEILTTCFDAKHFTYGHGYKIMHFAKRENVEIRPWTFVQNGHTMHLTQDTRDCSSIK